jgi:hypothetical protein
MVQSSGVAAEARVLGFAAPPTSHGTRGKERTVRNNSIKVERLRGRLCVRLARDALLSALGFSIRLVYT